MIERTFDYRIINRLASWKVRISREVIYLLEKKGKEIQGVWTFEQYKDGLRIHADMGEGCRGRKAINSALDAFGWVFGNTPADAIYAGIPADNKPACQIAARSGMSDMRSYSVEARNTDWILNERWFEIRRSEL